FAFRAGDRTPFTLPGLVANGTLSAAAAALLSLSVERGVAALVAGARGAGKTTLLGALLWELPQAVRTVVIEDTPELPVDALATHGRDVQPLQVGQDERSEISPEKALRTALRLGEGALVVGEVRGAEARTLYEAMRVGRGGSAVLGTIHGDGGETVRERVVSDLGVAESAFATTDLLVTCRARETPGGRDHRVASIEEVTGDESVEFAPLYERDEQFRPTERLDRGESRLLATLAEAGESYADVRDALAARRDLLARLVETERTTPADVVAAVESRSDG
ncbi:MAG: ATPase, T2SS/T4P/T4SS family, partial [Haloferacaceae archaeon]